MGLTYPSNKICPRCGTGGYVWYLDNSEYVAKCTNCNHYFRKDDFPMCVLDGAPKPVTNYDLLIRKTPEELAEFIGGDPMHDICPNDCFEDPDRPCKVCALKWLKEEVSK